MSTPITRELDPHHPYVAAVTAQYRDGLLTRAEYMRALTCAGSR